MLEIAGLRAGYGPIEVLRGVDLTVGAGEIVALLGSNGAGKSTLNNNVSGLYRPFGGSIRVQLAARAAFIHALQGDIPTAKTWAEELRRRLNFNCDVGFSLNSFCRAR